MSKRLAANASVSARTKAPVQAPLNTWKAAEPGCMANHGMSSTHQVGQSQSFTGCRNRAALLSRLQPKLLAAMQQCEFVSTPYDKAFACVRWLLLLPLTCSYTSFTQAWLQPDMVAVGTKSNHLLVLHIATGRVVNITLPPAPHRPPVPMQGEGCGIHCMAVSPSGTMLATGGHNVNDCLLLDVPSMEPVATIQGHDDWLFGAAWISNRHVVTGTCFCCISRSWCPVCM